MYACLHEYMYTCVCVCVRVYIRVYVCMYVCTYVYVCVYACMRVCICTYKYIHYFCQRAYALNLWDGGLHFQETSILPEGLRVKVTLPKFILFMPEG